MFLQDKKGRFWQPGKETEEKQKEKKRKKQKKKKCDPELVDDTPHPLDDVTIPSGEIDPEPADTPPIPQMT